MITSAYFYINLILSVLATSCLAMLFIKRKYFFIKPSIILLLYMNLFFHWPLTFKAVYYEKFIPYPYSLVGLLYVFFFVGLAINIYTFRLSAQKVWGRLEAVNISNDKNCMKALYTLGALMFSTMVLYLYHVDYSHTGLYALFFDPSHSAFARERSLKLVSSGLVKYTYSLMVASVSPIMVGLLFYLFRKSYYERNYSRLMIALFFTICMVLSVSVTGARSNLVYLLLVIAWLWYLGKGLPFRPFSVLTIIITCLTPAVLYSVLREGADITNVLNYAQSIFSRSFMVPLEVGSWYINYGQLYGPIGVGGIPKLASIMGVKPLDVPNFIGIVYGSFHEISPQIILESVSAGTSFLFSYYTYMGPWSMVLSLIGLCLLDVAVWVYVRINDVLLLPCIAAINISVLSFIQSDYTTVWLTHGFGPILILSYALNRLCCNK